VHIYALLALTSHIIPAIERDVSSKEQKQIINDISNNNILAINNIYTYAHKSTHTHTHIHVHVCINMFR
jgi:hypothetical protein